MTPDFKDHFSAQSQGYAKHRPTYPDELFHYLSTVVADRDLAWDCATGNGQAARGLAEYFTAVVATDASAAQIEAALPHPAVSYRVARAEASGLSEGSVALLTVGQAFHWFDQDAFWREAQRVLRDNGVLAVWCYGFCTVDYECDVVVETLYEDIVGDFWPPERLIIEQGYASVDLPGEVLPVPDITIVRRWRIDEMLGYLRTWSACNRYLEANGTDPVAEIEAPLAEAWGNGARKVSWPLILKVSRPNRLLE